MNFKMNKNHTQITLLCARSIGQQFGDNLHRGIQ